MVINEEQVHNNHTDCISGFKNELNETSKAYTVSATLCKSAISMAVLKFFQSLTLTYKFKCKN